MGYKVTSVRLDPQLERDLKDLAWRKRTSVSALVRQGAQIMLNEDKKEEKK